MKVKAGSSKKKKAVKKSDIKSVSEPSKDMSVRVEKIENGYIVSKSGSDKDGKWFEKKVFSETNPLEGVV
jgi:hypothetical protein